MTGWRNSITCAASATRATSALPPLTTTMTMTAAMERWRRHWSVPLWRGHARLLKGKELVKEHHQDQSVKPWHHCCNSRHLRRQKRPTSTCLPRIPVVAMMIQMTQGLLENDSWTLRRLMICAHAAHHHHHHHQTKSLVHQRRNGPFPRHLLPSGLNTAVELFTSMNFVLIKMWRTKSHIGSPSSLMSMGHLTLCKRNTNNLLMKRPLLMASEIQVVLS